MQIDLSGKVALITGAARSQGRSHAVTLARAGADIIAVDINDSVEGVRYPAATPADLAETGRQVMEAGRRVVTRQVDVRDRAALRDAVDEGVAELGGLDVVVANAGILNEIAPSWQLGVDQWQTMLDVNLTGVWHTTSVAVPHLVDRGGGGSVILISSTAGLRGIPNVAHYNAAKHGVVGLARTLANELALHRIRVNTIHPTNVRTIMIDNDVTPAVYRPDLQSPTFDDAQEVLTKINMWDVPWIESVDVSNAVLFLASEMARYITGIALPVDLGMSQKYSGA
ncbi:mycofactocin-coupled SDR family oxidoreductase [Rhodococcus opacus]|uniref:mycofactocin-coupled SDR family oxidoreductase n=1 Tax=Rhodococcus opacus TaxID=37919 RepID=UPI0024745D6C|nr:mycofactocin-coupled SDR family oxidoreductase [Rhodococcus opacus]MDH6292438.1 SDR family mycofactocin-dependent oxidoreductase [Rhodococcus opacus]